MTKLYFKRIGEPGTFPVEYEVTIDNKIVGSVRAIHPNANGTGRPKWVGFSKKGRKKTKRFPTRDLAAKAL